MGELDREGSSGPDSLTSPSRTAAPLTCHPGGRGGVPARGAGVLPQDGRSWCWRSLSDRGFA